MPEVKRGGSFSIYTKQIQSTEPYSLESLKVSPWSHFAISQRSHVIDFLRIIMLSLIFCLMVLKYCLYINVKSQVLSGGRRQQEYAIQREERILSAFLPFTSLLVFRCSSQIPLKIQTWRAMQMYKMERKKTCWKKDSIKSIMCSLKKWTQQNSQVT